MAAGATEAPLSGLAQPEGDHAQCATTGYNTPVMVALYSAYARNLNRSATEPLTIVLEVAANANAYTNFAL